MCSLYDDARDLASQLNSHFSSEDELRVALSRVDDVLERLTIDGGFKHVLKDSGLGPSVKRLSSRLDVPDFSRDIAASLVTKGVRCSKRHQTSCG